MKSHNCLAFLNVYVALIYVATWRNEEWSTKSQTFQLLVIIYIYILLAFRQKVLLSEATLNSNPQSQNSLQIRLSSQVSLRWCLVRGKVLGFPEMLKDSHV